MSRATCLDSCPDADLQDDFIKYPHSRIRDYSLTNFPRYGTLTKCVQLCLASSTPCRSFDFMVTSSTMCGASHIARFDVPTNKWEETNYDFEYYQRMCL
ncbi:hypothetical protein V1264_019369 [Littorina saxatilis]|uniref:Apple domain-containing protein n=1 Tax=Littorina saxatilis TaxID=31220 RepID=A0AAN9BEN8_9CAEN